jgi:A/G-specific adenine glycosylase
MSVSELQIAEFRETVWEYFRSHGRSMPWRDDPSAYSVLVSELMLQQTQVARVIPKFEAFMTRFPDLRILADAPLAEVLIAWNGLGYNRRAKFLHEAAKRVVADFGGELPKTRDELTTLPGIGPNTAGAIMVYAYNQPVVFIETNVRTVLFHHFFADYDSKVSDRELYAVSEQVLDSEYPRQWYWALMDYGSYLKRTVGGRLENSKHYKKQSPLAGSLREMRGRILRVLVNGEVSERELHRIVDADARYGKALEDLVREGMVMRKGGTIGLTGHTDAR